MRTVAPLLLTLLLAAVPAHADTHLGDFNECDDKIYLDAQRDSCKVFEMAEYSAPPQVTDRTTSHVFLWLGKAGGDARSAVTEDASLLGTLYGDTNGLLGLQRTSESRFGSRIAADDALLV